MALSCRDKMILNKEHIPPLISRFLSVLSERILFTLDCFGFERVGFNHSFHTALLSRKKVLQRISSKSKSKSVSKSKSKSKPKNSSSKNTAHNQKQLKKRSRGRQESNGGPPQKKPRSA